MTISELKNILGEQIAKVLDGDPTGKERQRIIENAEYVAKLSKQFINASDIQIRLKRLTIDEKQLSDNHADGINLE